jgi:uncharacterized protein (DUF58 family)
VPKLARDAAIAIAAGSVVLLLTVLIDGVPLGWQIAVTATAALGAFLVAFFLFASEEESQGRGLSSKKVAIGTDLDSTGSANVRRAEVVGHVDEDIDVGRRIKADDINIEDVSVRRASEDE